MVGIAEEPPRQLAPPVENATLDFVIRAGSVVINRVQITSKEKLSSSSSMINRSRLDGWTITS
jgi:hypothetical protein